MQSDLPVQLYANPILFPDEMQNIRTMLETMIYALKHPTARIVCTEQGPEELYPGFKNRENFEHHAKLVSPPSSLEESIASAAKRIGTEPVNIAVSYHNLDHL